jgi:uncharacterized protein (TIGR03435 family)
LRIAADAAYLVAVVLLATAVAGAQALSFEVASVKPNASPGPASLVADPGGGLRATRTPLRQLIRTAYGLQNDQIVGGPDWLDQERFDIIARARSGAALADLPQRLQSLLADRFGLVAHREQRELSVYALVTTRHDGRLGPALAPNGCTLDLAAPPAPGQRRCGEISEGFGRLTVTAVPIPVMAQYLSPRVNRVVIDRTGLSGTFDAELRWTPENLPPRAAGIPASQPVLVNGEAIDPNGPSIFTAIQEQLGLRLDATRAPVEVLVIDRIQRPLPD